MRQGPDRAALVVAVLVWLLGVVGWALATGRLVEHVAAEAVVGAVSGVTWWAIAVIVYRGMRSR